jgi:hypothetical protein
MTTTHGVSRLGWHDETHVPEVPHVRGVPVRVGHDDPVRWSWPNRLGVCESDREIDIVLWRSELAPRPDRGRIEQSDPSIVDPTTLSDRLRWFRSLLKRLDQHRGVSPLGAIDAPAAIVMTRAGVPLDTRFGTLSGAVEPVPARLGEFPGGVQLALTDLAWRQRDQYAALVESITTGSG